MTLSGLIAELETHRDQHGRGDLPIKVEVAGEKVSARDVGFVAGAGSGVAECVIIMAVAPSK